MPERSRGLLQTTEQRGISLAKERQERKRGFLHPEIGPLPPRRDGANQAGLRYDRGSEEGLQGPVGEGG